MTIRDFFTRKDLLFSVGFLSIFSVFLESSYPLITKVVTDSVLINHDIHALKKLGFVLIIVILAQIIVMFLISFISSIWSQTVISKIRYLLLHSFMFSNTSQLDEKFQTVIISDSEIIAGNIQNIFLTSLSASFSIIVYGVISFLLNKTLTVIMVVTLPIFVLLNLKLSTISQNFYVQIQEAKDALLSKMVNAISGIIFIKSYHVRQLSLDTLQDSNLSLKKSSIKFNTTITFISTMLSLLASIVPFGILVFGGFLVIHNKLSSGSLLALYSYSAMLLAPITQLVGLMPTIKETKASLNRIKTLGISSTTALFNPQDFGDNERRPAIYVRNLSYATRNKIVFNNIHLDLTGPELFLLTGPNGIGKSSLAKILAGLLPYKGTINFKKINSIMYVPQETFVFSGTILSNLTIGISNPDMNKLNEYCSDLQLINSDGLQLNTPVSNTNARLSTGQIQKIKLIHGLLSHDGCLIFDEILSNMDEESITVALRLLKKASKNKLIIIITHAPATVLNVISAKLINMDNNGINI